VALGDWLSGRVQSSIFSDLQCTDIGSSVPSQFFRIPFTQAEESPRVPIRWMQRGFRRATSRSLTVNQEAVDQLHREQRVNFTGVVLALFKVSSDHRLHAAAVPVWSR
jgi:hypothetical protein